MRTLTRFYRTFSKTFSKATGRFLLGYLLLHLLAVAIAVLVFSRIARDQMVHDAQAKMSTMTHMLAAQLDTFDRGLDDPRLSPSLQKLGNDTGLRFTVIDVDGVVGLDSAGVVMLATHIVDEPAQRLTKFPR
jgi:hypothetical protein